MKKKILSGLIAAYMVFAIHGTASASFMDSRSASMSMSAGSVDLAMNKIEADGSLVLRNKGTLAADLWLDPIIKVQNDPAAESSAPAKIDDKIKTITAEGAVAATVKVVYKGTEKAFALSDLDTCTEPLLLLQGMELGSEASVSVTQNEGEPNPIIEQPIDEEQNHAFTERIAVPVTYRFCFMLKRGTFTSMTCEADFSFTVWMKAEVEIEQPENADEKRKDIKDALPDESITDEPLTGAPEIKDDDRTKDSDEEPVTTAPEIKDTPQPDEPEKTEIVAPPEPEETEEISEPQPEAIDDAPPAQEQVDGDTPDKKENEPADPEPEDTDRIDTAPLPKEESDDPVPPDTPDADENADPAENSQTAE